MSNIVTWDNKLLTVTAKVDAVTNPSDIIIWDSAFELSLLPVEYVYTNVIHFTSSIYPQEGNQWINQGKWRLRVADGSVWSDGSKIYVGQYRQRGNVFLGNLVISSVNDEYIIDVPIGETYVLSCAQDGYPFHINLELSQLYYYDNGGCEPAISYNGDQLSVTYSWNPRKGTVRASAKIYDSAGAIRAVSGDVTLVVVSGAQQGGGS